MHFHSKEYMEMTFALLLLLLVLLLLKQILFTKYEEYLNHLLDFLLLLFVFLNLISKLTFIYIHKQAQF